MEGHKGKGSLHLAREPHGALYLRFGRPAGGKKQQWYQSPTPGPDFILAVRTAMW